MNKVWETKQKQAWPLSLSHVNGRMHGPSWSLKILAIKDCPPAAVSMGPSLNDSPFWNFCEVLCTASPCIGNIKPLVHEPPWVLFYHQTANLVNYNNPEEKLGGSSSGRGWSNIALEIICSDVQNAFFFFSFWIPKAYWAIGRKWSRSVVSDSFATLWTVAYQASLSMGFSRQRVPEQVAISFSADLSDPGIEPRSPALQADT